jgi:hypothetical protein
MHWRLNHLSWQGAYIRPSVSFNLGHIGQAADAEPEELSAEGTSDALADAGFTLPRQANEANNLALHAPSEPPHDEKLQDLTTDNQ